VDINGEIFYKKSEPHKAAVTGDTVGDPFKDTSGPSMNILIKLTSLVGLAIAPLIAVPSFTDGGGACCKMEQTTTCCAKDKGGKFAKMEECASKKSCCTKGEEAKCCDKPECGTKKSCCKKDKKADCCAKDKEMKSCGDKKDCGAEKSCCKKDKKATCSHSGEAPEGSAPEKHPK
jgi:hypothetical protein